MTHTPSGRKYVGATGNLQARLQGHRAAAKKHPAPLYAAVREDGWSAFSLRLLWRGDHGGEAQSREAGFISQMRSHAPAGFNRANPLAKSPPNIRKISVGAKHLLHRASAALSFGA